MTLRASTEHAPTKRAEKLPFTRCSTSARLLCYDNRQSPRFNQHTPECNVSAFLDDCNPPFDAFEQRKSLSLTPPCPTIIGSVCLVSIGASPMCRRKGEEKVTATKNDEDNEERKRGSARARTAAVSVIACSGGSWAVEEPVMRLKGDWRLCSES